MLPSAEVVFDGHLRRLKRLAPMGYAIGLHIRFASAHLMLQGYPAAWVETYTRKGYMLCDPLVSWGFAHEGAARWSALDHPDPHRVFNQAAEHGLRFGVAVAHGPTSSRTIAGFARSDREMTDAEIAEIQRILHILHEQSTPPDRLTNAQRMALRYIAQGCRYAEAAELLGVSESALKARLRSARERLFVRTTAEAIQRAQEYGLL